MHRKERIPLHDHVDDNSGGRLTTGSLGAVQTTSGGTSTSSGGASVLNDLGDVDLVTTPPVNNDSLTYDSATGQWVPEAVSGSGTFATPAIVLGSSAAAGAASTLIRSDSTIAAFDATSPTTQALGDSAVVGTAAFAARRDHKHAMPTAAVTTSGLTQATARLLGRTTASTGAIEEITVGTGLSLSAGSLTATGSGGSITVEEVDGSPTDSAVTKIVFPNGTLAIASHVATYTPAGGGSGGTVLLEQHTASSSASLDFTTFYSSTYDDYEIRFVNVVPATNNVDLSCRFSTNGGSTWDSSSNYYGSMFYTQNDGSTAGYSNNPGSAFFPAKALSNSTARSVVGALQVTGLASTTLNKTMSGRTTYTNQSFAVTGMYNGLFVFTTACNAIQFYMSSGNIASGTIRIYGVAK